jgi:nicotinamide phosphoribosyltransferase
MLDGLKRKGFASTNMVMGIGSYTYQHVTRDTDGWAMKATAGETESAGLVEIYKDPKTDDGTKKSARGLLRVDEFEGVMTLSDRVTWEQERGGALETVFCNGNLVRFQTLAEIRDIVL